jgi:iron complex transport system substrate-binding protein
MRVLAERDTSTALAAVGAADRIVARSGEGDLPLGPYTNVLERIPQITKDSADLPSPEVVLGQRADLVLAGHVTRQHVQALEAVGIPVIVPAWFCGEVFGDTAPVDFTDTYRTLQTLGRIFGTDDIARETVAELRRRVATVTRRFASAAPRPAMNVYLSPSQLYVYGGPSVNNAVLNTLGLTNVFADSKKRSTTISSEALVARNPTVIIVSFGTNYGISNGQQAVRVLAGMPGLAQLTAVREHRLITLNYSYLTGGPLTVDGLEMLARQLAEFK